MFARTLLTGTLPFAVLLAAALAIPISVFLLRLYRRAVNKGMSVGGIIEATTETPSTPGAPGQPPMPPLKMVMSSLATNGGQIDNRSAAYRVATQGPAVRAAVYAVAGAAFSITLTVGWFAATRDSTIVLTKVLLLLWTYYWTAVIAALLIAYYDAKRRLGLFLGYFSVLFLIFTLAVARNPDVTYGSLVLFWLLDNGPPTILIVAFLARPIRAVGPMVLSFTLAVTIGSQAILSAASADPRVLKSLASLGFALGLGGTAVFIAMIVLGALAFAVLAWPLLKLLGRRYARGRMSDQSLMLDSLWLMFGVVQSIGLVFEGAAWILTGVVAFLVYKMTALAALKILTRGSPRAVPALFLLRVFALGKRSEALFDKLRKHWGYLGSISMIVGPDLVSAAVEPHEFLDFLSGRLSRRFVSGSADLQTRIAEMEVHPDADARYRVNQFFCRRDTWQATMKRLASRSTSVLIDLRSFSAANKGCTYELGELLNSVPLGNVVFLVDSTTDHGFLEETLTRLWRDCELRSPNRQLEAAEVRVAQMHKQSAREIGRLLGMLLESARAHPVPAGTLPGDIVAAGTTHA
jgi:hypothetical protein